MDYQDTLEQLQSFVPDWDWLDVFHTSLDKDSREEVIFTIAYAIRSDWYALYPDKTLDEEALNDFCKEGAGQLN